MDYFQKHWSHESRLKTPNYSSELDLGCINNRRIWGGGTISNITLSLGVKKPKKPQVARMYLFEVLLGEGNNYTKFDIYGHLLFGIVQRCDCLLYISFLPTMVESVVWTL